MLKLNLKINTEGDNVAMYKKILIMVLVLCLIGSLNVSAEDKKIEIEVNGKALEMPGKIMEVQHEG